MFLCYRGVKENRVLDLPYFVGGPYHIDGANCVIEVDDADGVLLLEKNPRMFSAVSGPDPKPEGFVCDVCGKELKTSAGLASHKSQMHPDNDGGSEDADA